MTVEHRTLLGTAEKRKVSQPTVQALAKWMIVPDGDQIEVAVSPKIGDSPKLRPAVKSPIDQEVRPER